MTTSARTKYEPVPLPDQPPVSAGESLEAARAFFEKMATRHSVRHYAEKVSEAYLQCHCHSRPGTSGQISNRGISWPSVMLR